MIFESKQCYVYEVELTFLNCVHKNIINMSSHRYAKNRRDDAQRDSREDQNKTYHHYQEV